MSTHDNHLLGVLATADFAHYVGRIHGAAGDAVLDIDPDAHALALVNEAIQLLLVFCNHADDRNFIVGIKAHGAGVREVHAYGERASLPSDHSYGMGLMGLLEKFAKLGKRAHTRLW